MLKNQARAVLIVEDHQDARTVLTEVIEELLPDAVVTSTRTLMEARKLLANSTFDLALVDIGLPDGSGLDLIAEVRDRFATVVTTVFDDEDNLFAALRAGAVGYLLKGYTKAELKSYLGDLLQGKLALSPSVAMRVLEFFRADTAGEPEAAPSKANLTQRELEILRLVAKGLQTKEVAEMLDISVNTVSHHIKKIYTKLNIHNRAQAVSAAAELRLL